MVQRSETRLPKGLGLGVAAAIAMIAASPVAMALPNCEGTYAATSLHPLPAQVVVGLDVHDPSPENQQLAERFLEGIRSAGLTTGGTPTVLLHVTASILGETTSRSGSPVEQYYPGMSAIQGGMSPVPPALPDYRLTAPRTRMSPQLLIVRIDATVGQASRVSWVASLQCQRTGGDSGLLAYELGRVVGASLGQRVERRRL